MYAGRIDGGIAMWEDPIVAEVRQARLELEKEGEGDFAKIYARAVEIQKKLTDRLVSSPLGSAREKQADVELESA